jgi:aryl-alcohol dehydrogenase-like predicted oxidoreductase
VGEDAVALAAALAQPWATRVLSGAVTPEQVRSNASAADVLLPPDALDELGGLAEEPAAYWAARSRRAWS